MSDSQLKWQCRRGMRELDVLLSGFLERVYPHVDDAQKQAFRELLALPDPELIAYLLGDATPQDPAIADIVEKVRECPQA